MNGSLPSNTEDDFCAAEAIVSRPLKRLPPLGRVSGALSLTFMGFSTDDSSMVEINCAESNKNSLSFFISNPVTLPFAVSVHKGVFLGEEDSMGAVSRFLRGRSKGHIFCIFCSFFQRQFLHMSELNSVSLILISFRVIQSVYICVYKD